MITVQDISKRIAEAIKQSGVKQTDLAEKIGVRQQQISSYIKGKTLPSIDTLANLCAVLDLDANEILCLS